MSVAQKKVVPAWTNLQPIVAEAMTNYITDNNISVSEFIRSCIAAKLLDEGYLQQEQLEVIVFGK